MMLTRLTASLVAAAVLAGCATPPPATYTSSAIYQPLDCYQLASEAMRVQTAAQTQAAAKASKDSITGVAVVAGLFLFWPALFLIQSTAAEEGEINRLRADADAIQQAAIGKRCPLQMTMPAAPPTAAEQARPVSCVTGTNC